MDAACGVNEAARLRLERAEAIAAGHVVQEKVAFTLMTVSPSVGQRQSTEISGARQAPALRRAISVSRTRAILVIFMSFGSHMRALICAQMT